jgi:hypothetical protein
MVTLIALGIGLPVWIILWALGAKPFDAFLVTLVIVLPAAGWQVFSPGIKKMLGLSTPPSSTS